MLFVKRGDPSGAPDWHGNAIVKFTNLPFFQPAIASVFFRMYISFLGDDRERSISVSALRSGEWNESSVTWNTLDATTTRSPATLKTITHQDINSWMEVEVTNLFTRGSENLDLLIESIGKSTKRNVVQFRSTEDDGWEPRLVFSDSSSTVEFRSGTNSAFCLTVDLSPGDHGKGYEDSIVALFSCEGADSQRWEINAFGFVRSSLNSTLCLTVDSLEIRSIPFLSSCEEENIGQKWAFIDSGEFKPVLDPNMTMCLDLCRNTAVNGQSITLWRCHYEWRGARNELWLRHAV